MLAKNGPGLALALTAAGVVLGSAGDALACGGCFSMAPSSPTMTQQVVTDHRMALAIGSTESILWDQIRYSGDPAEFSWVLPVTGDVTVELGSSLFIDTLDSLTAPVVQAPPPRTIDCGCYPNYGYGGADASRSAADASAADAAPPPVTVVSEATVGPYETVTLRSTDATALTDWLTAHNYVIPASIQPVIQAYVDQHMDFVALRLLPGEGVDAMQPVKIRYHTANMVLPLRMVGAGISDKVGLTLFVFGLGRHEAANFGNGVIDETQLTWDWGSNTSDYAQVFSSTLQGINSGRGWITQFAGPSNAFSAAIASTAQRYCAQRGLGYYACANGAVQTDAGAGDDGGTRAQALQDAAALYTDWQNAGGYLNDTWITRMRTDLLARYLDSDLVVQPRTDSTRVPTLLRATRQVGNGPTTCSYHYCPASDAGGGSDDAGNPTGSASGSGPQCAAPPAAGGARGGILGALGALGIAGLAAFVARRRK